MKYHTLFSFAVAEMVVAMAVENFLLYAGGVLLAVYVLPRWAETWPKK